MASAQVDRSDIEKLTVTERWKTRFRLLEKAGGPSLHNLKALSLSERFMISMNLWGVLFGPLYYVAKGMWKKAVVFTGVGLLVIAAIAWALSLAGAVYLADSLGYGLAAVFGARANIDYYKKMVLGQDGWW